MSDYIKLVDLVDSISKTHKFEKDKLIFLNTSDVSEGKILVNHYSEVITLKGQAKKTIKNGDILYSEIRPKNKRYAYVKNLVNPEDYVVSTKLMVLRNKSNMLNNDYLYHFLTSDATLNYLQRKAENRIGSFPQITFDVLKIIKIWLPNLKTQQKIAAVLSALDDKIELNNQLNAQLEQMAKTIYDYWFVQFDFPEENGKPYKSSGGKMVFNEVLKREIPVGWEVKSLYQIANFINGLACQKYRPKNEDDPFLPVIKIREMNDGISTNTDKVRVDIPEKNIIKDGDVLFSWSATLDVKLWTEGKGGLNQHIFKITSDKFPRSFYYFEILNYLHHFKMMAELRKTTMGHITIDHLKSSFITIPQIEIINKLDQKINPILEKIISSKKQNQEIAQLRDWLLPLLMNGQVRVGSTGYDSEEGGLGMVAEGKTVYKSEHN